MLRNDATFWTPRDPESAAQKSWGSSQGQFLALWNHSKARWGSILSVLRAASLPGPAGRIVEFGAGMGLLDDLLDEDTSEILMLDHTKGYIEHRPTPLSRRVRHVLFTADSLRELQREGPVRDWLIFIAVFYHVDSATAAALILELGQLVRQGGHVLVHGWNKADAETIRANAGPVRLFDPYPRYFIDLELIGAALSPDFEEALRRPTTLVYRKR